MLCVDEKSQIQALDRSAPVLPLMPGVPARQSHDSVPNGITNRHAALDVAAGQLLAELTPRHRAEEFRLIDTSVPAHLEVHVVLDNSSDPIDPALARPPPAFQPPFHTDLQLLAQSRRTLVHGADDEVDQTRSTPLRP